MDLPPEYQKPPDQTAYCADRFGPKFLQELSKTATNYCNLDSSSSLTCFRTQTSADGRVDSFCVGSPSLFDSEQGKFLLDCPLREWTEQEAAEKIPRIERFPYYWYQTGPHFILDRYFHIGAAKEIRSHLANSPENFSILVRREQPYTNMWHGLMQIFVLYMSLDVLQMARNPATNMPFFRPEDMENTQVVILDDYPEDPYFDLWSAFAKKPPIRAGATSKERPVSLGNVIIPLAGASNPFWQSDWEVRSCDQSELLDVFSRRVLHFYGISDESSQEDRPLVLTYIDRRQKRRLVNQESCLKKLKAGFPNVEVISVDFAAISFPEQLKIVRRTDILVGVHGAGLTHGIFLPHGSTMVEITPYNLNHKGFRNIAKLRGHRYFGSHTIEHPIEGLTGDWQQDDVFIEEDRFMALLDAAIKSMYNRGMHNEDIS